MSSELENIKTALADRHRIERVLGGDSGSWSWVSLMRAPPEEPGSIEGCTKGRMLSVLIPLLMMACTTSAPPPDHPQDVSVASWENVDVVRFNSRVDEAVDAGLEWPRSALSLVLNLLGGDADTRSLALSEVANRGEAPDTVVVVLSRDGLLDDSVRGDWHRAALHRLGDGTWRLHELHRAFRCWRSGSLEEYSAERCL
jgi:hypothetical protein